MSTFTGPQIFDDSSRNHSKHSVLRSIIPSKGHKRSPSAGDALVSRRMGSIDLNILPSDHPHARPQQNPLGERALNRDAVRAPAGQINPRVSPGNPYLHKKTKSTLSLKGLMGDRDKKESKSSGSSSGNSSDKSVKKLKSSTNLAALLKRSQRGKKTDSQADAGDKENRTPTEEPPPPIWSLFASQPVHDNSGTVYVPANTRTLEEEVSLYTPQLYSPSKQRNFHDYHQPTLVKRAEEKPRPKSDYISSGTLKVKEALAQVQRTSFEKKRSPSGRTGFKPEQGTVENPLNVERKPTIGALTKSRVKAAVTAFNAKDTELSRPVDPKQLESDFEKMLDSRNIPHNMRDKMRSLGTHIKQDLIRQHQAEKPVSSAVSTPTAIDSTGRHRGREETKSGDKSTQDKGSRSRSRGRTFTLSRGDRSPKKHQKTDSGSSHKRAKSTELGRPGSFKPLLQNLSTSSLPSNGPKEVTADPDDFIHYMREVRKPELVEVGKLHKLRLLLRNETVGWVDTFISHGGMSEIIQLLQRIMNVEWREEHEDTLLHETLLCLKALCTTSKALKQLTQIEDELFPALVKMIFDEERKGPSEYTTRGVVFSLLFTHLSAASESEMPDRAAKILGYLRDPVPANQQLEFITNIYQARPYKVWCKEVSNVTKEVFWIFLHHLNVIPVRQDEAARCSYFQRHYPSLRPPVPAAPYVGGVEWDATNYVAAHLDLMNGLIACLPSQEERNCLRRELRASGFEKVMGGSLRTCKEKFYGAVHDCLKTWVSAAVEDGWDHLTVREGASRNGEPASPMKSPVKPAAGSPRKKASEAPPRLSLGMDAEKQPIAKKDDDFAVWV